MVEKNSLKREQNTLQGKKFSPTRVKLSYERIKLLRITLSIDLSWSENTKNIVKRAYGRLWTIRRLKSLGASTSDLKDIFKKQVRSILEFTAPAWNSNLTEQCSIEIERVQKSHLLLVLGPQYESYSKSLVTLGLDTLRSTMPKICTKKESKSP